LERGWGEVNRNYLYLMFYFAKNPWFFKALWPSRTWSINTSEKNIYLTFDDGPHPVATPFVLDVLKQYNALGTFFCIGKNVQQYPGIYQRILDEGHAVGNHTQHHLNGWKTAKEKYLDDIKQASQHIDSRIFRPPYGRIRSSQAKEVRQHSSIIMWSVLSGDFDTRISVERCLKNVINNTKQGSIVVFHDSEKAFGLLKEVLPQVVQHFSGQGYLFQKINQ
jgi:peptidoglycan-N-acetylglucosamine deacetylase